MPLVQEFTPEESEDRLYNLVSDYLRRDNLQALPASQRQLMTLVLRKLLASSHLRHRRRARHDRQAPARRSLRSRRAAPNSATTNWSRTTKRSTKPRRNGPTRTPSSRLRPSRPRVPSRRKSPTSTRSRRWRPPSSTTPRARRCSKALASAFAKAAASSGAAQKAIIFTESRRTQEYLLRLLADTPTRRHRPVQRLEHRRALEGDLQATG